MKAVNVSISMWLFLIFIFFVLVTSGSSYAEQPHRVFEKSTWVSMDWAKFDSNSIMYQMSDRPRGNNPDRIFLKRTEIIIDGYKGTAQVIKLPPFDKLNYLYQVSFQIENSKENKCDVYTNKLSKVYGKANNTRDLSYSREVKITEDSGLTIKHDSFNKLSDWKVGNSRLLLSCTGFRFGDPPARQWFMISFKTSEYAHEIKDVIWISCDLLYEYHTPDGTENRGSKIVIVGLDDFERRLLKYDKSSAGKRVRYNVDFVEVRSEGNNNIVTTTLINRLTGEMNMKFMSTKDTRYYQTGIGSCEITDINKKKF